MNDRACTVTVRVAQRYEEAPDICRLVLQAADGAALPPFEAGAHIDVHLPGGLVRQYSLCNPPSGDAPAAEYHIAVLRTADSRGGSQAVHAQLQPGSTLTISSPRNLFALAAQADHHLLLAGGIGITPLLAMAEQLTQRGQPFTLHYCNRSPARAAFTQQLTQAPYAGQVSLHYDDGPPDQQLQLPQRLARMPAGTHLYVCGPQGFMDAALQAARAAGWAQERLHSESFTPAPQAQAQAGDGGFELELAGSGRIVAVEAGQTALQALLAAGVDLPFSCEQGICGTCLTRVLSGTPEHRDQYLTEEEQAANDQFLPCCSRSQSPRLVLDL